jgi:hypothetical protein
MSARPPETADSRLETLTRYLTLAYDGDPLKGLDVLVKSHAHHQPEVLVKYVAKSDDAGHVRDRARKLLLHAKDNTALKQLDRGTLQYQAAARTIRHIERIRDERPAGGGGLADRFNLAVFQLVEDLYEVCILMSTNNAEGAAEYCHSHAPLLEGLKADYRDRPDAATLDRIRKCKRALESNSLYLRLYEEALDEYLVGLRRIQGINARMRALQAARR